MGQSDDYQKNLEILLRFVELGSGLTEVFRRIPGGESATDNIGVTVLCHLELDGPQRPNDIVAFTGLTSGGVTKVITRLEGAGLVDRERNVLEHDKRAVSVSLTDRGHALMDAFSSELSAYMPGAGVLIKELNRLIE